MFDRRQTIDPSTLFGANWKPARFRGQDGGWLGLATPMSFGPGNPAWLVLEGEFFEGADQVLGATAADEQGGRVEIASDVNVGGAVGRWRLALRRGDRTPSVPIVRLPYVVDPDRGLFCTGARWVPERDGLVQLRWLGEGARLTVDLQSECSFAPSTPIPEAPKRDFDIGALQGRGLRSVGSHLGKVERWTAPDMTLILPTPSTGWRSVRLAGRNCLGYRQIFDARITVDGEPASFFCHIRQEVDGLGWSIDLAACSVGEQVEVRCLFPKTESEIEDSELGVCLDRVSMTRGLLRGEGTERVVAPFVTIDDGYADGAPIYGRHLLIATAAEASLLEINIRDAGLGDYVLAYSAGRTLVEKARALTPEGAKFVFRLEPDTTGCNGWAAVTVRRFSSTGANIELADFRLV